MSAAAEPAKQPPALRDVPLPVKKKFKSLAILVQSLTGLRVVVETKTGKCITGVLESCDPGLNLLLKDVSACYTEGRHQGDAPTREDEYYVNGTSIRFVHLPDEVPDAARHVHAYRTKLDKQRSLYARRDYSKQAQRRPHANPYAEPPPAVEY